MARVSKIRVLQVITRLIRGGAQREVLELLAGLDRRRFRVALACHPQAQWVKRGAALANAFYPITDLVRPISPGRDLQATIHLLRLMRRERCDIVHTHTSKAGILGRLAARAAHVPVIVHTPHGTVFHESFLTPRMQRIIARVERMSARWTDCIITKSDYEADEYVQRGIAPRSKFPTIHSGLDFSRLDFVGGSPQAVRERIGATDGRPIVLYPARFVPEKDHASFLRAFAIVADHIPDAMAVLAGDGPLRSKVEAASLIQRGALLSLGFCDDLPDLMRSANVCVSASLTEGLPLTVAEALALGCAVVATDAGGTREVVLNGETGVLVPCADPKALAAGILHLLQHPEEAARMAQAGREHVRPLFDARLMVKRTEQLYEECLARKGLAAGVPSLGAQAGEESLKPSRRPPCGARARGTDSSLAGGGRPERSGLT